jgi:hypothetical protein
MATQQFDVPLTPIIDTVTGSVTEIGRIFLRTLTAAVGALAPIDAQYWLSSSAAALTNERNLGALATGYLKITQAIGIAVPSTVTTIPQADVTGLAAALAGLAPLASPAFTGNPSAPTPTAGDNDTSLATTAFVVAMKPTQVLNRQAGDVANVGTGETTLKSVALAAGQLAVNGDSVRLESWGTYAANTDSKTLRLYFGATVVMLVVDASATHLTWKAWAEITRTAAGTQIACGTEDSQVTGSLFTLTAPTETLSGAITVKLTGQSAVGSNDLIAKNWLVTFLPNA